MAIYGIEIGDIVTIAGQSFYVIEKSDETKSTVKLLAANCVDTRTEVESVENTNHNKQTETTYTVAFDSTEPYSNVYADSTIKPLVDSYVASLGVTVIEGRLMTKEEVVNLGGSIENISTEDCPAFINAKTFWLGSPHVNISINEWYVNGRDKGLQARSVTFDFGCGLRPVIVISKSNIPAQ